MDGFPRTHLEFGVILGLGSVVFVEHSHPQMVDFHLPGLHRLPPLVQIHVLKVEEEEP